MIWLSLASGSGSFIQANDQCFDEFSSQPYDALILSLNTRPGLQHEPCDIDGQAQYENERQKRDEAGAQR